MNAKVKVIKNLFIASKLKAFQHSCFTMCECCVYGGDKHFSGVVLNALRVSVVSFQKLFCISFRFYPRSKLCMITCRVFGAHKTFTFATIQ